ncbi:MAG: DUF6786 family protein [Luteolibacter sp.]
MTPKLFQLATCLSLGTGIALSTPSYEEDVAFLKHHTEIVELSAGSSRVAIAPAFQARVMTSAADGPGSPGFGWINREVIATGIKPETERAPLAKHIHVFGGEERLWFGPEGGPFALFFPPKVEQVFANWKTPAVMDTVPFGTVGQAAKDTATFSKTFDLPNRAGTVFSMAVQRTVSLVAADELAKLTGGPLPDDVRGVAYTTANTVKNAGDKPWNRETGAPSVWLLGMFKPTPGTTIVIPFEPGDPSEKGPRANTEYFGKIPDSRIKFGESVIFYKGDGTERGKLGVPPKRSKGLAGSWQEDSGTLTLLRIDTTAQASGKAWPYVDSQWKEDVDPFGGDAINAYNDGPPEPGAKPLGPFYELESSSPALLLKPGESYTHSQTTTHLTGNRKSLDAVARKVLGVSLDEINSAFKP